MMKTYSKGKPCMSAVIDAISREDPVDLECLLLNDAILDETLHFRTEEGLSPLHIAATSKHHAPFLMRVLLEAGFDVNTRDDEGKTALIALIDKVSDTVVVRSQVLITHGVHINVKDNSGSTALVAAWRRAIRPRTLPDAEPLMHFLLDRGADPNVKLDEERNTLLHDAVNHGNRHLINRLVMRHKADANARNIYGETPLHLAASNFGAGLSTIMTLLEAGEADPCIADDMGRTPLMHLCSLSFSGLPRIDALLEYVSEPKTLYLDARDKAHWSALMHASNNIYGATMALHLLNLGANPCLKDKAGNTVLMSMIKTISSPSDDATFIKAIEKCLESGLDPNIRDHRGQTALHHAAQNDSYPMFKVIQLLLKYGADPFTPDHFGCLPLYFTCRSIMKQNPEDKIYILLKAMSGQQQIGR